MIARYARTDPPHAKRTDLKNIARILPLLTAYRGRAVVALLCLVASKVAVVAVPVVLKELVDYLTGKGVECGEYQDRYGATGMGHSIYIKDIVGNNVELRSIAQQAPDRVPQTGRRS